LKLITTTDSNRLKRTIYSPTYPVIFALDRPPQLPFFLSLGGTIITCPLCKNVSNIGERNTSIKKEIWSNQKEDVVLKTKARKGVSKGEPGWWYDVEGFGYN
jgi:hypothetical protein